MEAKKTILNRLNNQAALIIHDSVAADRKNQIGLGMSGDKIRTYRFQDDIVKDHKSNKSAKCSKILSGYFDLLWD